MNELELKIIEACETMPTMSKAAQRVGLPYTTFKYKAIKLNVWKPNQGGRNTKKPIKNLEDVFSGKRKMKSYNLRNRMIAEGYKENKWECCGTGEEWEGKVLVLELDHINGDHSDNRLENLRILCPNCHSQTPTFRGRKYKVHGLG